MISLFRAICWEYGSSSGGAESAGSVVAAPKASGAMQAMAISPRGRWLRNGPFMYASFPVLVGFCEVGGRSVVSVMCGRVRRSTPPTARAPTSTMPFATSCSSVLQPCRTMSVKSDASSSEPIAPPMKDPSPPLNVAPPRSAAVIESSSVPRPTERST